MPDYTYDSYMVSKDGNGFSGGEGATDLQYQLMMFGMLKERHPEDIHFVVRRPDRKIEAFYHPNNSGSSELELLTSLTAKQLIQVSACLKRGKI